MQKDVIIPPGMCDSRLEPNTVVRCTKSGSTSNSTLGGTKSVENLEDLKEVVLRKGMGMREKDEDEDDALSSQGIRAPWKKFTTGYRRWYGTIDDGFVRSVIHIDATGDFGKILNIVPHNATAAILIWVGEFFWSLDWKLYASEYLDL
ncbi:hypothetical protein F5Y16DRAFT_397876 [Xylariaceae sp. FL0255]|nr:hypothetical protein F5Y16DRAFT_397876 [Xylariaceae sp. FL0255]